MIRELAFQCAYEALFWSSGFALSLGSSLRVEGSRHMPRRGPVLVLANHQSVLDPLLVGLAVYRRLNFLARRTLFDNPGFGQLIRFLHAVPVDQEGIGIAGLRTVLHLLEQDRAVLVFPEGSRTSNGSIQPLQAGIQLIIKRAQPVIVPVGISGAFDAWPAQQSLPRFAPLFFPPRSGSIAVAVRPAIDSSRLAALPREQLLTELGAILHAAHLRAEHLRRKA
jgi:1-acyl-sn-glycerol-3-phosphate acyltransferase